MGTRKLLAAASVLALVLPVSVASADDSTDTTGVSDLVTATSSGEAIAGLPELELPTSGQVTVMVELTDEPVTVVEANTDGSLSEAQAQEVAAKLESAQDSVAIAVQRLGGQVVSTLQWTYNGLKVTIDASQLDALREVEGVKAVHGIPQHERFNVNGVPDIGAPDVWAGVNGTSYTGEGVKVAVVDTGIDYTHKTFGGAGTEEAFTAATAEANPTRPLSPRVADGIDLAGDAYDGHNTPVPDNNPIDCIQAGHGTHVAGTVGGSGVLADGSTYAGPYDSTTYDNNTFEVGPGVAPTAELYAIRAFGCSGSTNLTVDAIEAAVKQFDVDVINLSLGSAYGTVYDPSAVAASNAVAAGVVVVASAGNSGSQPYLVGSPSTGAGVISVAATDPTAQFPAAKLGMGGTEIVGINANDAPLPAEAKVHVLKAADGSIALGCTAAEYADVQPGDIVVTQRGNCARVARAVYGDMAGAAAVVMVNSADSLPAYEGPIRGIPSTDVAHEVDIPFIGVKNSDAATLVAADGSTITLTAGSLPNPNHRAYGSFSSAGPRSGDSFVAPSLSAPGVSIMSARVGGGSTGAINSGTSMAAPHVAGVAALVKQARPEWTGEEIAAAMVGTADADKVTEYGVTRGGGLVDPVDAVRTSVVAYSDSTPVNTTDGVKEVHDSTLSFGYAEFADIYQETRTITLVNKGSEAVTYSAKTVASTQSLPASASVGAESVTVPAGGIATVEVTLSVKASDVPSSVATSGERPWYYEVSGNVVFTSSAQDGVNLSVPYLLVPRSLSNVEGSASSAAEGSFDITLTNQGSILDARASVFTLGLTDAEDVSDDNDRGIDLASAGVQTYEDDGKQYLAFAINSYSRHSNAAANTYTVQIDADQDGTADYSLFSRDSGLVRTGYTDGKPEVFLLDLSNNVTYTTGFSPIAPTDSSTVVLPVALEQLGDLGAFNYRVDVVNLSSERGDTIDEWATYDPTNRAFQDGQTFPVAAGAVGRLSLTYDAATVEAQKTKGWMVVVFDNAQGTTEAITGDIPAPAPPTPEPTPSASADPTPEPTPSASADPTASPSASASAAPTPGKPTPVPVKPGLPRTGDLA